MDDPIFEMDAGFMSARYGARSVDGLTVTTNVDSVDFWGIPEDTRRVGVSGHEATLYFGEAFGGTTTSTPTVSVVWRDDDGEWTGVTGRGVGADAGRVEAFADLDVTVSLVDNPPNDFGRATGVDEITTAQVHNAQALVGQHAEGDWMVLATTPDGQAYSVSTPQVFTRDQVIALAEGVTFTR